MRREDRDGRKVTPKDRSAQLYQVEQCDWRWTLDVVDEADDEADDDDVDAEMEKRNKIAQTQVLDLKIAQKTRNLRHIIIHAKTA